MRYFLLAAVLFVVCNCSRPPYFNLRKPIYLVTHQSFWSGCEVDSESEMECRSYRVAQLNAGIAQWLDPLKDTLHSQAFIFLSEEQVPPKRVNSIIYLRVQSGFCGKGHGACYAWALSSHSPSVEIVFDSPSEIMPRVMAHEFGHVLGRDDNDVPKGVGSVMSYTIKTNVSPLDIKMMCRLHHECYKTIRK